MFIFFFNDTATTEIYTLSLHDALPILVIIGKQLRQKTKEIIELTIHDALANLGALSEMKIDAKEPIGIVKKHKIVIEDEEFSYRSMDWFISDDAESLIESIKDTYRVVLDYLIKIYEKDFIDFDDPKCRKGIQAIMVMATDAANKIGRAHV